MRVKYSIKRIEVIIGSLALLLVSANLLGAPGAGAGMVLVLSLLAMFYFYFAFPILNQQPIQAVFAKHRNDENLFQPNASRFIGVAISISIIGCLYKLQDWPMANDILLIGVGGLTIAGTVMYIVYRKEKSMLFSMALKRIAIFDVIGLVFLTA